ncbi:hypothetical protein K461DRAFT_324485 [Myriangium duriaei CBS 260.36]|uniref:histidine kinase n=1 Tax=Myriangium duriaei CBS 260.36 TaxID=1168546 RepID=A0A9P4IYH0_9PEZI|nr:hypothetical protein K461DRAFT_324485 [Myriangium duriaei CBS 260.36]
MASLQSDLPCDLAHLGLVDFLETDERPTFIVETSSSPRSGDSNTPQTIVYVNQSCHNKTPQYAVLNSQSGSTSLRLQHRWLGWLRSARSGDKFEDDYTTWSLTILRHRWRVFTCTLLNRALSDPPSQPSQDLFDVALKSESITPEHHAFLQNIEWDKTHLGPLSTWPTEIRHIVALVLAHPSPACVYLGEDRIILYNPAFAPLIKNLHPQALGRSAKVAFDSFWDYFEKMFCSMLETRKAVSQGNVSVPLIRSDDSLEETFFSYVHIPIWDSAGQFLGVLNEPREVTGEVLSKRRMSNLLKIGEVSSSIIRLDQFWPAILQAFDFEDSEVPFAAIYTRHDSLDTQNRSENHPGRDDNILKLEGTMGQRAAHFAEEIDLLSDSGIALAIRQSMSSSDALLVRYQEVLRPGSGHFKDQKPTTDEDRVVVVPIHISSVHHAAWIIIGIHSLRPYDHECNTFIQLMTKQIATGATALVHLAEERKEALLEKQRLAQELAIKKKEAEDSALRFLEFAKHSPVGVYIFGPNGEIKFANETWYRLFSLPSGSRGDQLWRQTLHPDDLHLVDEKWMLLANHGTNHAHFEFRVMKQPNETLVGGSDCRYLSSTCFAEVDENGNLASVTGVIVDETVHKAHEREVGERLAGAIEAKRTQENFMDMVSHEMRNPLNAIIQCAEEAVQLIEPHTSRNSTAISQDEATASLDAVKTILYCGNHQKTIIDDVLTISKLDSNLLTLAPSESSPVAIANQAVQIYNSEIRASDIDVSIISAVEGEIVMIDAGRVLQILMNLIGNAVKFLKGRSRRKLIVTVAVSQTRPVPEDVSFVPSGLRRRPQSDDWTNNKRQSDDWTNNKRRYVFFKVQDTGPGMDPEQSSKLFGRFRQASPKTHSQYGGSGLGLFISRELSELHGGEIGLKSVPDVGSTFAFYVRGFAPRSSDPRPSLPVPHTDKKSSDFSTSAPLSAKSSNDETSLQNLSVLVVEDNLINQTVLVRQLGRQGFKTITADNGKEALDRIGDSPQISIVLCDLEMPIMDGLTCVKHVRDKEKCGEIARHIPMVAVTGNARSGQIEIAKDAGFDDVVSKPYSFSKLVPLMTELVAKMTVQ